MPFDSLWFDSFDPSPIVEPRIVEPSASEAFAFRREHAAALWRTIPQSAFSLLTWECDTTACAIGWMGVLNHDGWSITGSRGSRAPQHKEFGSSFVGAARYFGLSMMDSEMCFASHRQTAKMHGHRFTSQVTPSDVARTLLTLPYYF